MDSRLVELFLFWRQSASTSIYEDSLEVGHCDSSHGVSTCVNFAQVQMEGGSE